MLMECFLWNGPGANQSNERYTRNLCAEIYGHNSHLIVRHRHHNFAVNAKL